MTKRGTPEHLKSRLPSYYMAETPPALDAIADTVLAYRPKARSKPAVQRKRRRTILEKKRAAK